MFEEEIQKLGLTEGETRVYLALLEIGSTTVGPLVKKSGVSYSKIYEVLNRLIKKGLVSYIIKEKTKYFQAMEPTRLEEYLIEQEDKIKSNRELLAKILPSLKKFKEASRKQEEAQIFVGKKGLLTAYENLLKDAIKKEIGQFFYVYDEINYEKATQFYTKIFKLFKKLNIKWNGIINEEYRKIELSRKPPPFISHRYVPFPVPGNIDIFRDKVLIIAWGDQPVGLLIQSQEIANNFRMYFNSIWKIAKP